MQAKSAFRVLGAGLILLGFGVSATTVSAAIGSTYISSISSPSSGIEQPAAGESAPGPLQVAQRRVAPSAAPPPRGRAGPRRMGSPRSPFARSGAAPVSFGCPPPSFLDPEGPPFGPPTAFPPPFRPCPVSP